MEWLVRSAMCDLYPKTDDLPGLSNLELEEFVRTLRKETTRLNWGGVVAGSLVYTMTPMLTVRRPLPSFVLSPRLRNLHAERISYHRSYLLRQLVFLLKLTAGMCWGADPSVRKHFDLDPYAPDPSTSVKTGEDVSA